MKLARKFGVLVLLMSWNPLALAAGAPAPVKPPEKPAVATGAELTLPTPAVPGTDLDFWNQDDNIKENNNCYNYSTNRITNSFAQPGEASGKEYVDLTCESVIAAASVDLGLIKTSTFALQSPNQDTMIALVIDPGNDFHWYRRDRSGKWSHKPGSWPATNIDNSGKEITSPETADRGNYTQFCGYFRVKNFDYQTNLQNGGYVRIGNMTSLPALPKTADVKQVNETFDFFGALGNIQQMIGASEIELVAFSGRRNPRVSLRQALADPEFSSLIQAGLAANSSVAGGLGKARVAPKLGLMGVVIHDREGLVIPRGSEMFLPTESMQGAQFNGDVAQVLRAKFAELMK